METKIKITPNVMEKTVLKNSLDVQCKEGVSDSAHGKNSLCENSEGGSVSSADMSKEGGGDVFTQIADRKSEKSKIVQHFCAICQQSFTRADSVRRHTKRKHPSLDDGSKYPKHPAAEVLGNSCISPTKKQKAVVSSVKQIDDVKKKIIKIVLSKETPSPKNSSRNSNEEEEKKSEPTFSEEENAALQSIKDSCKKLQDIGRHVLVISADPTRSQWFGSDYGLEFAKDHTEVISSFFNYCKAKYDAVVKEKVQEHQEDLNAAKNVIVEDNDNNDADYSEIWKDLEDRDEEIDDDDMEGDSDDDIAAADDDFVDDNNKDKQKMFKQLSYEQYLESKEKLFQEIADSLLGAEETRDAAAITMVLRKKVVTGGRRYINFTVGDLNKGKYKCVACGYNFIWKCHLELHQVKNPYCSRVKSFEMSKKDVFEEEITFKTSETGVEVTSTFQELLDSQTVQPLRCAVCQKSNFRDRGMLARHLITHNIADIFECNICCEGFCKLGLLSTHLKNHFKKPYECHRCQWRFSSSLTLDLHISSGCQSISLIKNKEKDASFQSTAYSCEICSAEVTGTEALREHLTQKHGKQFGVFDCVLCDKKFPDTKLYNSHLLTHSKQHQCPFCTKKFGSKTDAYYQHLKLHKEAIAKEYTFICDICGEKFRRKRYLESHRRIHTGERPFVCEEEGCGKGFRSKDGLDQHKWCHKNQHFLCDFCGRKFKKPSFLRNHRRTHTVEWRYPCIYCTEKFKSLRPFKHHLAKNHPNCVEEVKEKFKIILHACRLCPKVFYDKEDYTTHMYRHNGIKPFPCSSCGKRFNDKSNLLQHEASHSGGKRLKCDWCSRRFNEEKYLLSHIERLHTSKQEKELAIEKDVTEEEDIDELRENTLQIIDETIRGNASF